MARRRQITTYVSTYILGCGRKRTGTEKTIQLFSIIHDVQTLRVILRFTNSVPAGWIIPYGNSAIEVKLPMSDYADYVDMLRNESPLIVTANERTSYFKLYTKREDVGEAEIEIDEEAE